ncbi:transglutaminase domain-containing protein [halophilic archaeon DL31]|nr:transglutaminase domain-containing protein [halophilic archaeon DL31]
MSRPSGSPAPGRKGLDAALTGMLNRVFPVDQEWELRTAVTNPALLGLLLLTLSYLQVLFHVTDVVGGTGLLLAEIAAVLILGLVLAPRFDARRALLGSLLLLVAGLVVYYYAIPESQRALIDAGTFTKDFLALLTGLSVFRLLEAQIWALAVLPAPLLGSWLLALRGRYPLSVLLGGTVLVLFVLTGDAGPTTTLLGVIGATLAVGLAELVPRKALSAQWDTVVLVITVMVVLSASVSLVPGGAARPAFVNTGTPSLESNLVDNTDSVGVVGSIRLSPAVRFTIESERESYWKVGSYDRYTGNGWVRTGESRQYSGQLDGPPGESVEVEQTVTAETPLNSMPAAWKPVQVEGSVRRATQVTTQDGLRAATAIDEGESYTVTSEVAQYSSGDLRSAGTDYPDEIEQRYLGLPDSTPDRVRERTDEVVADADTPYEAAVAIESYLESNKRYSLSVQQPEGNIADAFLFEMDAGYCTYYATTMVTMLRTQGVPARFVTGYTSGERVAEDRWVVRGLDAHAWVEVYFPDIGWVAFDPTPGAAREGAEGQRLAEARENEEEGVDTTESGPEEWTPTPTATHTDSETATNGSENGSSGGTLVGTPDLGPRGGSEATAGSLGDFTPAGGESDDGGSGLPTREELGYGFAFLLGSIAATRRFGLDRRLYRFVWLRYQPRSEPVADVERAYERMEAVLASRYGARRRGETVADYLERLAVSDERVRLAGELYERAHYGGRASETEADRVVSAVNELVAETTPLLGRLRR